MATEENAPERTVARLRAHSRALVLPFVALLAACAAGGFLFGSLPEPWQNGLVLGAAIAVAILLWLVPVLVWFSRSYTVTTRRIIVRRGLWTRSRQELLHSRGYDVTLRRSPFQGVWRSGTILINAGLEHPVVLKDVPQADLVLQALQQLMEENINPVALARHRDSAVSAEETAVWEGAGRDD